MRRSLAPSQVRNNNNGLLKGSNESSENNRRNSTGSTGRDSDMTISRLPLFGFLQIPEALNKQFKVPSGCVITEENIALRKRKSLGGLKKLPLVLPGQFRNKDIKRSSISPTGEDDDDAAEELPTKTSLPPFEPLVLWQHAEDETRKIEVIADLASKLRPHQREGVQFLFECTMGMRGFEGQGCILADDMGLGKTLMSITILWTLLYQGMAEPKKHSITGKLQQQSAVRKVMVVCPTSLVGNWDNELRRWVGDTVPTYAVKSEPKKMIKNFLIDTNKAILIISYETQRIYSKLFEGAVKKSAASASTINPSPYNGVCDLLICDEAHKLKNSDSGLAQSLSKLPARKRILLSGTPMQNELTEFFNMVDFCNPGILGTVQQFRRKYERPILAAREPDATDTENAKATQLQKELSTIVNEFILKRGNILNAKHLPPKLVQFVCCRLTSVQEELYRCLLNSKELRHISEGKQTNTLNSIRQLINICSHPRLILDAYNAKIQANEPVDDELKELVKLVPTASSASSGSGSNSSSSGSGSGSSASGLSSSSRSGGIGMSGTRMSAVIQQRRSLLLQPAGKKGGGGGGGSSSSSTGYLDHEQSGKMIVLHRMMSTMRAVKQGERIVVVSNYTMTLDLIEAMCEQNHWPVLRLDGTISGTKRTQLVDQFNDPKTNAFAFLLSSKAGGCGINLIGGNRLVLFDPDWNPASDKQAAGRIWREGQKRRCFIYRFMSTGTIEEKIIQRQLSKEGLADIVDDKDQTNSFSTQELKQLFELQTDTQSDTHDTLRCTRCKSAKMQSSRKANIGGSGGDGERGGGGGKKQTASKQALGLSPEVVDSACGFLDDFMQEMLETSISHMKRQQQKSASSAVAPVGGMCSSTSSNTTVEQLPFFVDVEKLKEQLRSGEFDTMTAYSRKQRRLFQELETEYIVFREAAATADDRAGKAAQLIAELSEDPSADPSLAAAAVASAEEERAADDIARKYASLYPASFSLVSEFLRCWTEFAPSLTRLQQAMAASEKNKAKQTVDRTSDNSNSGGVGGVDEEVIDDEEEFVEQEGCPDDTAFKEWSHHCTVKSCDDDILKRSLVDDDSTVSFVFGLEVNWDLLQEKQEREKEANAERAERHRQELAALNEQRRAEAEAKQAREARRAARIAAGKGASSVGESSSSDDDEEDGVGIGSDKDAENEKLTIASNSNSNSKRKKHITEDTTVVVAAKGKKLSKAAAAAAKKLKAAGTIVGAGTQTNSAVKSKTGSNSNRRNSKGDKASSVALPATDASVAPPIWSDDEVDESVELIDITSPDPVRTPATTSSSLKGKKNSSFAAAESATETTILGRCENTHADENGRGGGDGVSERLAITPPPAFTESDFNVDFEFKTEDWGQLKRLAAKKKISLGNFLDVWTALRKKNNNWRLTYAGKGDGFDGEGGDGAGGLLFLYNRARDLTKYCLRHKFVENVDYFRSEEAVLHFVAAQMRLLGDGDLLPSSPIAAAAAAADNHNHNSSSNSNSNSSNKNCKDIEVVELLSPIPSRSRAAASAPSSTGVDDSRTSTAGSRGRRQSQSNSNSTAASGSGGSATGVQDSNNASASCGAAVTTTTGTAIDSLAQLGAPAAAKRGGESISTTTTTTTTNNNTYSRSSSKPANNSTAAAALSAAKKRRRLVIDDETDDDDEEDKDNTAVDENFNGSNIATKPVPPTEELLAPITKNTSFTSSAAKSTSSRAVTAAAAASTVAASPAVKRKKSSAMYYSSSGGSSSSDDSPPAAECGLDVDSAVSASALGLLGDSRGGGSKAEAAAEAAVGTEEYAPFGSPDSVVTAHTTDVTAATTTISTTPGAWTCKACTMLNDGPIAALLDACSVCHTARGGRRGGRARGEMHETGESNNRDSSSSRTARKSQRVSSEAEQGAATAIVQS